MEKGGQAPGVGSKRKERGREKERAVAMKGIWRGEEEEEDRESRERR